jgi:hypothetical protein
MLMIDEKKSPKERGSTILGKLKLLLEVQIIITIKQYRTKPHSIHCYLQC